MESTARYSALDHGGLEYAGPQDNGPEVVSPPIPPADAPEVFSDADRKHRSILEAPETVHPGQYDVDPHASMPAAYPVYYGADAKPGQLAQPIHPDGDMAYGHAEKGGAVMGAQHERKYLGMKKRTFIIVAIVAAILILGAILGGAIGGVLGSKKHNDSSYMSSSPVTPTALTAQSGAGLATAVSVDGSLLLTYYQDTDGSVYENVWNGNTFSLSSSNMDAGLVTSSAAPGYPLAAVSYVTGGKTYRQLFFFASTGLLMQTNTTTTNGTFATNWSTPSQVAGSASAPNVVGLAACARNDTLGLNGVRVYFGVNVGGIAEYYYDFNETAQGWLSGVYWDASNGYAADASSGVACTSYVGTNTSDISQKTINVYLRNGTTGLVEYLYWSFDSQGWYPASSVSQYSNNGTSIAACNDGAQTEYVLFQGSSGNLVLASTEPLGTEFDGMTTLGSVSNNSKLTASYYDTDLTYLFQNASSTSEVWLTGQSRNGVVQVNQAYT